MRQKISEFIFKHAPGILIGTIATTIISSLASEMYSYTKESYRKYVDPFAWEESFLKSIKLNTNITKRLEDEKMYPSERLVAGKSYKFICRKNFILSFQTNKNGILESYAVFSRNSEFHPSIPYTDSKLGELSFEEIEASTEKIGTPTYTRGIEYFEMLHAGRQTGYEPIWIGYYSYGLASYKNDSEVLEEVFPNFVPVPSQESIITFRKIAIPNAYAYGGNYDTSDSKSDAIDAHDLNEIYQLCND